MDVIDTITDKGWAEAVKVFPEASRHIDVLDAALEARCREHASLKDYESAQKSCETAWALAAGALNCH